MNKGKGDNSGRKAGTRSARSGNRETAVWDADKSQMTNLGEIEVVIREQLQEHVSPQVGIFLSRALLAQRTDTAAP